MAKKTKNAVANSGKKDSLKMVKLTWILTLLVVPVVATLVPAFFSPEEYGVLTTDSEIAWLLVIKNMVLMVLPFIFVSVVVSLIVALLCKKELPSVFPDKMSRYFFLLSSSINTFVILFFLFILLMRLFGFNG